MSVIIETTKGDITVDLYVKERPRSCMNFLKLCKLKYYNGCKFNKIEKDFIAQTGDPTNTGNGGDSIFYHVYGENARFFEYELKPNLSHEKIGTLSMINNGENLLGSQFFLTLSANLDYLDKVHTVFGYVVDGLDVLFKLNDVLCDEKFRPYLDIYITHTVVLDDPFKNPEQIEFPLNSPEINESILNNDAFDFGENYDENEKTKTIEEIEEEIKEKEAKARAYILEMIGDIPDADVKPPDNVLFVCKLNSITKDDDLEVIFSRFGKIVSCEVIKDQKTGESLQYAFIEFEKAEDCEKAYFKMDNVLIDDRRIHVDFSQSVSKIKWHGKGKGVTVTEDGNDHRNHRDYQYNKNESRRYRNEHDRYERRYSKDRQQAKSSHYRRTRSRSPSKNRYASSSSASSSKFYKPTRRRSRSKSPYYHERDQRYRSHHHHHQQQYRRTDERSSGNNNKHERSRDYDSYSSRSSSSRHHHHHPNQYYHRDSRH